MSGDLAAQVAAIHDRFAIDDLLTGYASSLDDRDWASLSALFTSDAEFDFTQAYGIAAGRDEFVTWLAGQVTREFAREVQHHLTNRRWRINGDTATGTTDFFNPDIINDGNGGEFLLMNGGRYDFEARRTEAGWRLTRLVGAMLWSHRGDLMVFELPDS